MIPVNEAEAHSDPEDDIPPGTPLPWGFLAMLALSWALVAGIVVMCLR